MQHGAGHVCMMHGMASTCMGFLFAQHPLLSSQTDACALTGYDGLLSSASVNSKKAQWKPEDRIFSGSSATFAQTCTAAH